jgi:hypothetical protein
MAREGPEFQRGRSVLQSAVRSWKPYSVIPEIDIWRAASLLIRRHGADAELEAAKRADLMLARGDDDGPALVDADQTGNRGPTGAARWKVRLRGRIGLLRAVEQLGEKANISNEFQGSFGIILDQLVGARVPEPCYGAREHHHEAQLLILVTLIREGVEPEDWRVWREHSLHQRRTSSDSPLRWRTRSLSALTASSMAFA